MKSNHVPICELKEIIETIIKEYEITGVEIINHQARIKPKSESEKIWGCMSSTGFLTLIITGEKIESKYFKPVKPKLKE